MLFSGLQGLYGLQPAFMRPERVTPTEKAGVTGVTGVTSRDIHFFGVTGVIGV